MFGCGAGIAAWLGMAGLWLGTILSALWVVSRLFPATTSKDEPDLPPRGKAEPGQLIAHAVPSPPSRMERR